MSTITNGLAIAQQFIGCVETRDREGVERLLHPKARQVFVLNTDPAHPSGVFEGKDEVLAYTFGLFGKFDSLVWVDKDWTVSADGARVFMQAQSDGVASHSKAAYRNTYVIRFDIAGERIVQILEYALDDVFLALGTPPGDWDKRAVDLARTLPYGTVADPSLVGSGN